MIFLKKIDGEKIMSRGKNKRKKRKKRKKRQIFIQPVKIFSAESVVFNLRDVNRQIFRRRRINLPLSYIIIDDFFKM